MMGYRTALREAFVDLRLSPTARQVRRDRLTYLSPQKMQRIERAIAGLHGAVVGGAFVEFGVALGGSSIVLARAARQQGRAFHGFDVFGTIPPPTAADTDDVHERYETIASGQSRGIAGDPYYGYRDDLIGDVRAALARFGVPEDRDAIRLHKGLFEDTWPESGVTAVAFAHVDCDWHDPVAYCLRALHAVLAVGGAIAVDDYHDYDSCRNATDAFLGSTPGYEVDDGSNLILRRVF